MLFGSDKVDMDNKSNHIPIIGQPKKSKYKPILKTKTAEQRKNEELYGRSVAKYGTGKKADSKNMHEGEMMQSAPTST
jgi:hypothetical protein